MTLSTLKVLRVLLDELDGEHYGFNLSQATGLKSGTLYPLLARLEQHGLVQSCWEDINPKLAGRPARRLYRLTAAGIRRAEAELAHLRAPAQARVAGGLL